MFSILIENHQFSGEKAAIISVQAEDVKKCTCPIFLLYPSSTSPHPLRKPKVLSSPLPPPKSHPHPNHLLYQPIFHTLQPRIPKSPLPFNSVHGTSHPPPTPTPSTPGTTSHRRRHISRTPKRSTPSNALRPSPLLTSTVSIAIRPNGGTGSMPTTRRISSKTGNGCSRNFPSWRL